MQNIFCWTLRTSLANLAKYGIKILQNAEHFLTSVYEYKYILFPNFSKILSTAKFVL